MLYVSAYGTVPADRCLSTKLGLTSSFCIAQIKNYIAALSDARNLMRKEHARLQSEQGRASCSS